MNDYIAFDDIDSDIVTFFTNDIGLNSIKIILILMMIILTIVILKLLIIFTIYNRLGVINMSNESILRKIDGEFLPMAWRPTRVWDW